MGKRQLFTRNDLTEDAARLHGLRFPHAMGLDGCV